MHTHVTENLTKGIIGVIAPAAGVVVSLFPELEFWMRIASMGLGMAVSAITFISIYRNNWGKRKDK